MTVSRILRWFGWRTVATAARRNGATEDDVLDRILAAEPRAGSIERAIGLLSDLSRDRARELVHGVARNFLAYVYDLPASERHHHSEPFGLIDHSLEVAELALRAASTRYFVSSTAAYPEEQDFRLPRLRYGAWFSGLVHDGGKITQVVVSAPGFEAWNPYLETLADFYARQGRENCTLTWRAGRGMDAHVWHTAYLHARLIVPAVAEHLGPRILSELLEQKTDAAKEVGTLVSEADARSTREALSRATEAAIEVRDEPRPAAPAALAVGEWVSRVPEILARAISEEVLRAGGLSADILAGRRHLLFKYPKAFQKLAKVVRDAVGRENADARSLDATEEGARRLAQRLHKARKLFYDPETDAWKLKAKVAEGGVFDVTAAVLVRRDFLEAAAPELRSLPTFAGEVALARAADGAPIATDDFTTASAAALAAEPPPPAPVPAAPPPASAGTPKPRPEPERIDVLLAPPAPAVAALRKFISAEVLLDDIRAAILNQSIPTNVWNGQVYILQDVTYLASPRGFQRLVEKGLYDRDPKTQVNVYLDALGKLPCVRKTGVGRVLTTISVRPGARPLWAVAFDTRGLFRSDTEIARVGYWTESPVRELSEGEARALRPRAAAGNDLLQQPPPAVAPGVVHA